MSCKPGCQRQLGAVESIGLVKVVIDYWVLVGWSFAIRKQCLHRLRRFASSLLLCQALRVIAGKATLRSPRASLVWQLITTPALSLTPGAAAIDRNFSATGEDNVCHRAVSLALSVGQQTWAITPARTFAAQVRRLPAAVCAR